MKAAIYCRVSTAEQAMEGQSISAQKNLLHQYALQHGYEIADEFIDEGASARSADRPQFQRMIAMAKVKPKPWDAILIHKFDRFARNREDSVVYKNLLRRECDIEVLSITEPVDDSPVSRLMEGILEVMAEFYSLNLAQEVQKGMREKAQHGKALGMTPFGYEIGEDGSMQIVPEEAEVVRYIFRKYIATNSGLRAIATDLRQNGLKLFGPAGVKHKWSNVGLRVMITNEVYTGTFVWNRRDGSRNHKIREEDEWIVVEDAHEPIIDKETFEEAQRILESKRTRRKKTPDYLLRGLVKCMDCGWAMGQFFHRWKRKDGTKMEKAMLRCHNYQNTGDCYFNNVGQEELESSVFDFLRQVVNGGVSPADTDIQFTENNDMQNRVEYLERQLDSVDSRFDRQVQAFEAGVLTLEQLQTAKTRLEKERQEMRDELSDLQHVLSDSARGSSQLRNKVAEALSIASNPNAPLRERQKALAGIIEKIEYSKQQDMVKVLFKL